MRTRARPLALLLLAAAAGCYRVNSRLLDTPEPPDGLYRCLQLELGRSGYAIVGADRASGWLHAQRRIERIHNSYARDDAEHILQTCAPGGLAGAADTGGTR